MAEPTLLDPVKVLRRLTGSGAYVIVTFGSGGTAKGSIVASDDDTSVLLDHDATASFVRHESVLAVTVRDAHAFEGELGLPGVEVGAAPLRHEDEAPEVATESAAPAGALSLLEVQSLLRATGFAYDESALLGADPVGRAGLALLASVVNEALRSIGQDPAANEAMKKDITAVRLADGVTNSAVIDGTTLVVTSPWLRGGPGSIYEPGSLRAAILDAAD